MTFPNSGTQFTAASFTQALAINNNSSINGTASATWVDKYQSNTLTAGGSNVRLTFKAPSGGKTWITACYIGNAASTGNAYDFDGSQVQVTFNSGANSATINASTSVVSDTISFSVNPANVILVAFNMPTTSWFNGFGTSLGAKYVRYTHIANQAASTVKSASYTANGGQSGVISLFEVMG